MFLWACLGRQLWSASSNWCVENWASKVEGNISVARLSKAYTALENISHQYLICKKYNNSPCKTKRLRPCRFSEVFLNVLSQRSVLSCHVLVTCTAAILKVSFCLQFTNGELSFLTRLNFCNCTLKQSVFHYSWRKDK